MASKTQASAALFLSLSLLFFAVVTGCNPAGCGPTTMPPPKPPQIPCPPVAPVPPSGGKCPIDSVKLGGCLNLLDGLINLKLGAPPKKPCCPLLQGYADFEAAVCLCTLLKGNVLGLPLTLPINFSVVLGYCGLGAPVGFICP